MLHQRPYRYRPGYECRDQAPGRSQEFLDWVATPEFAELYSNALPGFFSLSNAQITLKDPLAQEFMSWRGQCKSTIRNSYQILSRGEPNLENELWRVSATVINGTLTPEQAAQEIQDGLDKWYKPQIRRLMMVDVGAKCFAAALFSPFLGGCRHATHDPSAPQAPLHIRFS